MTNIIYIWCSNVTRIVTRVVLRIRVHDCVICAFHFHGIAAIVHGIVWTDTITIAITRMSIVYATYVDIYTMTTPRTWTSVARTYTRGKWSSSMQIIASHLAVFADWMHNLTWWDAWRSLSTRLSKCGHVWSSSTSRCHDWLSRAEAFAYDSFESEAEVFRE